jgi:hypothetical protein
VQNVLVSPQVDAALNRIPECAQTPTKPNRIWLTYPLMNWGRWPGHPYPKTLDRVIASAERQGRGPYTNVQYCLTAYHLTEHTRGYTPCIVGR